VRLSHAEGGRTELRLSHAAPQEALQEQLPPLCRVRVPPLSHRCLLRHQSVHHRLAVRNATAMLRQLAVACCAVQPVHHACLRDSARRGHHMQNACGCKKLPSMLSSLHANQRHSARVLWMAHA
jgi:hypothetical protein